MREAARLADRIVVLTSRPGRIADEIKVDIERPRRIDSPEVAASPLRSPIVCVRRCADMPETFGFTDQLPRNELPSPGSSAPAMQEELAGLDALELAGRKTPWARRAWSATWPKVLAIAIGIGLWQLVVWSGWKPTYVLASPRQAWDALWADASDGTLWSAVEITMRRAIVGFSAALVIGVAIGLPVSRSKVLRAGVGSLITGLQTMPSIAWFPLAILIFKLTEAAILFVVILGAAPSIANGLIAGVDQIPPLFRGPAVLGARGISTDRHVVLPAAVPGFVAGLKQGWAFAWRSLWRASSS